MSSKGCIFDIQRFCTHDGPGIRTTIFLKGCPLNCQWCHNPESKSSKPEVFYQSDFCVNCGACANVCPQGLHLIADEGHLFLREGCISCGSCADVCPRRAIRLMGREMTSQQLLEKVLPDKPFYQKSGGGVTFSGGEPLLQADFLKESAQLMKQHGIHICVETSGFASWERIHPLLPLIDIFLFDWKVTNEEDHLKFTGAGNQLIRKNLANLNAANASVILRCPLIPGKNMNEEHLAGIAEAANNHKCIQTIDLEPYHPLGSSKAKAVGRNYELEDLTQPSKEEIDKWINELGMRVNVPVRKA